MEANCCGHLDYLGWYPWFDCRHSAHWAKPLFMVGLLAIMISIVAVAGGLCALKRRAWGLALAGSICSVFCWLGIPAIIFIALSKQEFS